MLCERCQAKTSASRQVKIICQKCGKEEYVSVYNDNYCKACNEEAGTCEECGRKLSEAYIKASKNRVRMG